MIKIHFKIKFSKEPTEDDINKLLDYSYLRYSSVKFDSDVKILTSDHYYYTVDFVIKLDNNISNELLAKSILFDFIEIGATVFEIPLKRKNKENCSHYYFCEVE